MNRNSIIINDWSKIRLERVAAGTITPGMLLEINSDDKVVAHNSAGADVAPILFALEDGFQGNDIHDDYSALDRVQVMLCRPGDEVQAILDDGQDISIGDLLESNGNGQLVKFANDTIHTDSDDSTGFTAYTRVIVGQAIEAVDTSESSAVSSGDSGIGYSKRILIRIV